MLVGLLLVLIRGLLLWLVVPAAVLGWLVAWPLLRRRQVRMGQFLGWVDLNLVAWIEHTILRAAIRSPRAWTPAIAMPAIKHRIGWSHPA
jgi:hypothetical protein